MGVGGNHAVCLAGHGIALHMLEQHCGFKRFHQEITGATAHRIHGLLHVTKGGHQQNGKLGQALAQLRKELQTIHGLHLQIGQGPD
jgi:hypothetical protein